MADQDTSAGCREDARTGQYVPTVGGVDTSPTSFEKERALKIAEEQARWVEPPLKRYGIWRDSKEPFSQRLVCVVMARDKAHARRVAAQNCLAIGRGYFASEMSDEAYKRLWRWEGAISSPVMTLEQRIELFAKSLPEGWRVEISVERGAGTVKAVRPDGSEVVMGDGESSITQQFADAGKLAADETEADKLSAGGPG